MKSCRTRYEIIEERMIDSEVANPFKMLSAYFITAAMTKPPHAFKLHDKKVNILSICIW